MKNDAITEDFTKRFQEWDDKLTRTNLIWITWALALDVALHVEFDAVVSDIRRQVQHEM